MNYGYGEVVEWNKYDGSKNEHPEHDLQDLSDEEFESLEILGNHDLLEEPKELHGRKKRLSGLYNL